MVYILKAKQFDILSDGKEGEETLAVRITYTLTDGVNDTTSIEEISNFHPGDIDANDMAAREAAVLSAANTP